MVGPLLAAAALFSACSTAFGASGSIPLPSPTISISSTGTPLSTPNPNQCSTDNAVTEPNITTSGNLTCIKYAFPPEVQEAQLCGSVFAAIGQNPTPKWVLNFTRSGNPGDYLSFFGVAGQVIGGIGGGSSSSVPISDVCIEQALVLLCRYVFPTCDPAFVNPTYQPICRRACFTLQDFLCREFFKQLGLAIQAGLLEGSIIDPPVCGPLMDNEAGNAPDCISTLDGGSIPEAIKTTTCYFGKGRGYSGSVNVTASGKTCQKWSCQAPHQFLLPSNQYLELKGDHNYCRNPGSRGEKPWCFTTDPQTRWEYCNIALCSEGPQCEYYNPNGLCRLYGTIGYDYIYNDRSNRAEEDLESDISLIASFVTSQDNERCANLILDLVCHLYFPSCDLSESSPIPIRVCRDFCDEVLNMDSECSEIFNNLKNFAKIRSLSLPQNCDNLPAKSSLNTQCYTALTSPTIADPVTECYKVEDAGVSYNGTTSVSVNGRACLYWDPAVPVDTRQINSLLRPHLVGHNYCRNPEQRGSGPWCYVMTEQGITIEYCDIPQCTPSYIYIIIGSICGAVLLLLCLIVLIAVLCCTCKMCRKSHRANMGLLAPNTIDGDYRLKSLDRPVSPLAVNHHYLTSGELQSGNSLADDLDLRQFPREDVVYIRDLGQGNFGLVVQAEARGIISGEDSTTVAVKVLKENSSLQAKKEFFKEASLMHEFEHQNILRLLGVCIEQEPLCMIFEYMELGDLNNFLRKNDPRKVAGSKQSLSSDGGKLLHDLDTYRLVNMTIDIIAGLEYLASHHYVHRDLATRNCLVNSNLRVKIADFGLSQDVYSSDYYRLGESSLLPVRWMPPEAIIYGKFTLQSDIWSFGVVGWELFSYGQQPYYGLTNEEVCKHVRNAQTLECPENAPQEIYDLMLDCWNMEPSERPNASELHIGLRRWNPDMSASLSLQRSASTQPNYQNMAVVKEYEKQAPSSLRRSTISASSDLPPTPEIQEEARRSTMAVSNVSARSSKAVSDLGVIEDEL